MSDEDDAYKTAQRLIAAAKADGSMRLSFDTDETRALTRLPPEIADLSALRRLDLDKTRITDLQPLAALTGLTTLRLNNTQVTDLRPLAALTGLTTLYLNNTRISDLQPLAALTGLTTLWLTDTRISDLQPLTALTRLTALSLSNTQISDLQPLAALTGLTTLSLTSTRITDLQPLTALIGLTTLYLNNTQITDLQPLTALIGLTTLYLNNTQITDLQPLTALTGLTTLSLTHTQITDLQPLAALTGLTALYLGNTQITDLQSLAALTGLTALWLTNTQITDLRPLRNLQGLVENPENNGLTFTDTPATRADPRIAEIAEIKDPATRARELFAYLKTWVPLGALGFLDNFGETAPAVPAFRPAPVLPILTDQGISLAKGPEVLAAANAVARAQDGWLALSEFRESFGTGFHIENYVPLPGILKCFDRAMGADYASCRPIAVGLHGQRLIALSADAGFLATLPTGAEPELKAFAAAIATFVERFPDWQEYCDDADTYAAMTEKDRTAFAQVDQALAATPQADQEFKDEFHSIVVIGSDQEATEIDRKGLESSTRELARALGVKALNGIKSGEFVKGQTIEMAQIGQVEWAKWKWRLGGFSLDALDRASPSLRALAKQRPKSFGWLIPVLDYLGTRHGDADGPP